VSLASSPAQQRTESILSGAYDGFCPACRLRRIGGKSANPRLRFVPLLGSLARSASAIRFALPRRALYRSVTWVQVIGAASVVKELWASCSLSSLIIIGSQPIKAIDNSQNSTWNVENHVNL